MEIFCQSQHSLQYCKSFGFSHYCIQYSIVKLYKIKYRTLYTFLRRIPCNCHFKHLFGSRCNLSAFYANIKLLSCRDISTVLSWNICICRRVKSASASYIYPYFSTFSLSHLLTPFSPFSLSHLSFLPALFSLSSLLVLSSLHLSTSPSAFSFFSPFSLLSLTFLPSHSALSPFSSPSLFLPALSPSVISPVTPFYLSILSACSHLLPRFSPFPSSLSPFYVLFLTLISAIYFFAYLLSSLLTPFFLSLHCFSPSTLSPPVYSSFV